MARTPTKQSKVLISLIAQNGIKRIAEIGVWHGHTTRNILRALGCYIESYWAIDPWIKYAGGRAHSQITGEQWDKMYFRLCIDTYFFPNLKILRLSSLDAARIFPKQYFDLVFIDAAHDYENVMKDITIWLPLVKPGGFLAGHDYGRGRKQLVGVTKAVKNCFGDNFEVAKVHDPSVWIKRV